MSFFEKIFITFAKHLIIGNFHPVATNVFEKE
jgi:hypothetical protein